MRSSLQPEAACGAQAPAEHRTGEGAPEGLGLDRLNIKKLPATAGGNIGPPSRCRAASDVSLASCPLEGRRPGVKGSDGWNGGRERGKGSTAKQEEGFGIYGRIA